MEKWSSEKKKKFIEKRINSEKITFESIKKSLINKNKHKHFNLKRIALISISLKLEENSDLFNEVFIPPKNFFPKVKPDLVFSGITSNGCYWLLCKKIEFKENNTSYQWYYSKSLMYCYRDHKKYKEMEKSMKANILISKIVQKKGG